jgi:hypothetical protein
MWVTGGFCRSLSIPPCHQSGTSDSSSGGHVSFAPQLTPPLHYCSSSPSSFPGSLPVIFISLLTGWIHNCVKHQTEAANQSMEAYIYRESSAVCLHKQVEGRGVRKVSRVEREAPCTGVADATLDEVTRETSTNGSASEFSFSFLSPTAAADTVVDLGPGVSGSRHTYQLFPSTAITSGSPTRGIPLSKSTNASPSPSPSSESPKQAPRSCIGECNRIPHSSRKLTPLFMTTANGG